MTCLDLKILVEKKDGIPVDQQRLVFSGKQLDNDRTMADYSIRACSTCHLILRLRGGMMTESSGKNGKYGSLDGYVFIIPEDEID